jgi:succinyl-diaminopimelate desuccinylase
MFMSGCLSVAQDLIRIPSLNPPGDEALCIDYLARLLEKTGLSVKSYEFAPNRPSLIARLSGTSNDPPLCFTGHVDVVPLGSQPWSQRPFGGDIVEGRLYGRGSSDMKAGIAAFVEAVRINSSTRLSRGITLVITSGEETGCQGAFDLVKRDVLGSASLLVVAEPSSNELVLAHKGSLRLAVTARGKTAHSSMPDLGDNAIYKAANWISRLEQFEIAKSKHPLLNSTTLCITTIHGGLNINSVPDAVTFTIDLRSIPGHTHAELLNAVRNALASEAEIRTVMDVPGFSTNLEDPAVQPVIAAYEKIFDRSPVPSGAPYFTDASALTPAFNNVPTVIIGPGDMQQAHQTDEYCMVKSIDETLEIYGQLIRDVCY